MIHQEIAATREEKSITVHDARKSLVADLRRDKPDTPEFWAKLPPVWAFDSGEWR